MEQNRYGDGKTLWARAVIFNPSTLIDIILYFFLFLFFAFTLRKVLVLQWFFSSFPIECWSGIKTKGHTAEV